MRRVVSTILATMMMLCASAAHAGPIAKSEPATTDHASVQRIEHLTDGATSLGAGDEDDVAALITVIGIVLLLVAFDGEI